MNQPIPLSFTYLESVKLYHFHPTSHSSSSLFPVMLRISLHSQAWDLSVQIVPPYPPKATKKLVVSVTFAVSIIYLNLDVQRPITSPWHTNSALNSDPSSVR